MNIRQKLSEFTAKFRSLDIPKEVSDALHHIAESVEHEFAVLRQEIADLRAGMGQSQPRTPPFQITGVGQVEAQPLQPPPQQGGDPNVTAQAQESNTTKPEDPKPGDA